MGFSVIYATAPKPHKDSNDDAAGREGNLFWLMDGATQLAPPEHGLDAAWHTRRLGASFAALAREKPYLALMELATAAVTTVGEEFYARSGLDAAAPQDLRPFSTLILCRLDAAGEKLEYLILCDSTLAVVSSARAETVSDGRLDANNFLAATNALLRAGQDFDSAEYKAAMRGVYDCSQPLLNKDGAAGAWYCVAQDAKSLKQALQGEIALAAGDNVLLMSDGFTRAVDTLGLYQNYGEVLAALEEKGPFALLEEIRAAERADSGGMKHQRSSRHDDATLLWVRV